ncbi:hypothetical protein HRbin15_02718 [bacterium HR15]|nr:hypothetical protein HRbin15_02718 [bacterium HR15]
MIDFKGGQHLLGDGIQQVVVFLNELLVGLLICLVACDVIGDLQVREDRKRVQPTLLFPDGVIIQRFGVENRPTGRFAVFIDQSPVVLHQVVGDALYSAPNLLFFLLICAQVIINRPDEVVPVQFVGAGVSLPDVVRVHGRFVPLAGGLVVARLAFMNDAAGGEARNAREPFEVEQSAHGAAGTLTGGGVSRSGILKHLRGAVERGP